ncbi:replication initiation factor domain-containing protein [Leisingera caerulea]|uniref:Replication initiation factor domain-containing protein n=1 Tax=Leisingera caerulea TaxID=506591 RepID=A0A9Q9LXL8_LEICA|nr:replication initiation factor domain-containing protein [Leisingera caerulea]UWQ54995.1 replication initiation factor domain-containing protein [Leisingera caerulea]
MPNIMLSGGHGACAELAGSLQRAFPNARLSRADAALDHSKPNLWEELLCVAQGVARGNSKLGGVRVIESDTGRTFYLGSRTSAVSLRVYEKDKERAARGVILAEEVDPDLVRIEWTFRPQSKRKAGMAGLSPGELIRSSVWARDFMVRAAMIMGITDRVERLNRQPVEGHTVEKTLEGTVRHGVHQYGRSFARLATELMVVRDHGGRHDLAVLDPDEVVNGVAELFADLLRETGIVHRVLVEERLDEAMDPDEWRNSFVHELMEEPERQDWALQKAQEKMRKRAVSVGIGTGCDAKGEEQ